MIGERGDQDLRLERRADERTHPEFRYVLHDPLYRLHGLRGRRAAVRPDATPQPIAALACSGGFPAATALARSREIFWT